MLASLPYEVLIAEALILLFYRLIYVRKKTEIAFLAAFLIFGFALALFEGADPLMLVVGIIIFNGLASTYHSKQNYAFFLLAVLYAVPILGSVTLVAQAILLGFLSAAYFFTKHAARLSLSLERRRDVVQVLLGLAFIVAFALFPYIYVTQLLIASMLLGSLVGNFSINNKKNRISQLLHSFERSDAMLGQGAVWLAVGVLVAISFLNGNQLVAVLVPLFIGDAIATLVGITYKRALPYNKKKSLYGTAAYFVSASLVSFPFVGYAGIITALVAALVESLPAHIDDNFDTAVALTILVKLLSYTRFI